MMSMPLNLVELDEKSISEIKSEATVSEDNRFHLKVLAEKNLNGPA